uniref:TPR_REGION domain-containing protein n=1 Tax=Rhabditophanes sp. KR3021 TaxID=114890 RepID=A0AC35TNL2_9BILA
MDSTQEMILSITKLVKEKNYDEAIVKAENLFKNRIKDHNLFVFAANAYINTAKFGKAKKCFLKGITLSPGKKIAYSGIIKMFDDKQIEASQDTLLAVDKLMHLEVGDPIKVSALTEKRSAMWLDLKMYDKLEDQLADINFLQKLLQSRAYIQFSAKF